MSAQLDAFRAKHPQYKDVPDQRLADALHTKFYNKMPKDRFYAAIGFAPERSWGDWGKMAVGSVAAGLGDLADVAAEALPGGKQARDLAAIAYAKLTGKPFTRSVAQAAYESGGAPTPATLKERAITSGIRGATGGVATGGTGLARAGLSTARNMAMNVAGGAGGGVGGEIGAEYGGAPGAFIGGLAGGVTGARAVARRAPPPQILAEGRQHRVPVLTSDVFPPQSPFGQQAIQNVPERIPWTGTGGVRARQQRARVAAGARLGEQYGAPVGGEVSPVLTDVTRDLTRTRGAELGRLTRDRDAIVNRAGGTVNADRTLTAIDQQIARLQQRGTNAAQTVVNQLQDWRQAIQGKDLPTINDIRREMGEAFSNPNLGEIRTVGQQALNRIYDPIRQDMGRHIRQQLGAGARNRWRDANDRLHAMSGELESGRLRNVLKTADITPENIGNMLFSSNRSDVNRLYGNLGVEGRARARTALVQKVINQSTGAEGLSPNRLAENLRKMRGQFGVFFQGQEAASIQGLQRVLAGTRRASQAMANPPTGHMAGPLASISGMGAGGYALGGGTGAAAAGAAAALPLGAGMMARIYESPVGRRLMVEIARTRPGSPQERLVMARIAALGADMAAQQQQNEEEAMQPPEGGQ